MNKKRKLTVSKKLLRAKEISIKQAGKSLSTLTSSSSSEANRYNKKASSSYKVQSIIKDKEEAACLKNQDSLCLVVEETRVQVSALLSFSEKHYLYQCQCNSENSALGRFIFPNTNSDNLNYKCQFKCNTSVAITKIEENEGKRMMDLNEDIDYSNHLPVKSFPTLSFFNYDDDKNSNSNSATNFSNINTSKSKLLRKERGQSSWRELASASSSANSNNDNKSKFGLRHLWASNKDNSENKTKQCNKKLELIRKRILLLLISILLLLMLQSSCCLSNHRAPLEASLLSSSTNRFNVGGSTKKPTMIRFNYEKQQPASNDNETFIIIGKANNNLSVPQQFGSTNLDHDFTLADSPNQSINDLATNSTDSMATMIKMMMIETSSMENNGNNYDDDDILIQTKQGIIKGSLYLSSSSNHLNLNLSSSDHQLPSSSSSSSSSAAFFSSKQNNLNENNKLNHVIRFLGKLYVCKINK